MTKVSVVVPNWNGADRLPSCLDALSKQTLKAHIIVVDNGSSDGSRALLYGQYPSVEIIPEPVNLGFAGGVNAGIRRAMERDDEYVALLNNDASPEPAWLSNLASVLNKSAMAGIVTSKIQDANGEYLDSTGEMFTTWGLPYPRGRREADTGQYDKQKDIFGASGGASLYRLAMLEKIGLFDEDFFAYYEDADLSFRAQLAGWKVLYEPSAVVKHHIGGTSNKISGFGTHQTVKNLPWLTIKNVPGPMLLKVLPRFSLAYLMIVGSSLFRDPMATLKGFGIMIALVPKKVYQRWRIQRARKISIRYIDSIIIRDLPPEAGRLRKLRSGWLRLIRRSK